MDLPISRKLAELRVRNPGLAQRFQEWAVDYEPHRAAARRQLVESNSVVTGGRPAPSEEEILDELEVRFDAELLVEADEAGLVQELLELHELFMELCRSGRADEFLSGLSRSKAPRPRIPRTHAC